MSIIAVLDYSNHEVEEVVENVNGEFLRIEPPKNGGRYMTI